ncbi:MAG: histidine kinase dimerization/phospho-acceptor domain-containing protein [Methylococcales bacterium]|nr:histidine kinase dimerization/phospho-acceptor domain-containing protein [Methylococcales bacterium]
MMTNVNPARKNDADMQTDQLLTFIDFAPLNSLFEPFLTATGLPAYLIALNGTVLASSTGTASDSYQTGNAYAAAVMVEGCHLANVCVVKPADIDSITEEKLPPLVAMLASWTQQIVVQSLAEQRTIAELNIANANAELAIQEKNAFIAHISHKLRSPLNAVMGFAQLMLHADNLPDEHHENASIIYNSGTHLLTLINDAVQNCTESEPKNQTPSLLTTQHLSVMPAEWLAQLSDALLQGETAQLMMLIHDIPPTQAFLSEQMTELVMEFQFECILDLIEPLMTGNH